MQGTPLPPIMALEKSPPRTPSALAGASLDIRSSNAASSSSSQGHSRQPPARCSTYSVRGSESWVAPRDMAHHKHLTNAVPEQPDPADRNGDGPRFTLPRGCKLGAMVGEGAANAVFEFQLPDGGYLHHQKTRTSPPSSCLTPTRISWNLTRCRAVTSDCKAACSG